MRSRSRFLVLMLPALLVPLACGDDGDEPGGAGPSGDGGGGGGSGLTLTNALGALPEGPEQETVVWGDMARAAELAGLERPGDASDPGDVVAYASALTGQRADGAGAGGTHVAVITPEAARVERMAEADAFEAELGWSLVDIDRFVERSTPPEVITVMEGDFDEGRMTEALGEARDGTWVAGDPDGDINIQEVTPARPIGETLWLGQVGDEVADGLAVTRGTDNTGAVRAAVAGEGDGPTLADDAALSALAAALEAEDAYGAMLVRPGILGTPLGQAAPVPPDRAGALLEEACATMLPRPTLATATGIADDDGPVVLVAQAHASGEDAEANAEALEEIVAEGASIASRQPWSELFTLEGVEVTGPDDTVSIGRLRPVEDIRARMWWDVVAQRDSLVAHC